MLFDALAATSSCLYLCIKRLFGFGFHAAYIRLILSARSWTFYFAGVREVYFSPPLATP